MLSKGPAWRSVWEQVRRWVVIRGDFLEEWGLKLDL